MLPATPLLCSAPTSDIIPCTALLPACAPACLQPPEMQRGGFGAAARTAGQVGAWKCTMLPAAACCCLCRLLLASSPAAMATLTVAVVAMCSPLTSAASPFHEPNFLQSAGQPCLCTTQCLSTALPRSHLTLPLCAAGLRRGCKTSAAGVCPSTDAGHQASSPIRGLVGLNLWVAGSRRLMRAGQIRAGRPGVWQIPPPIKRAAQSGVHLPPS